MPPSFTRFFPRFAAYPKTAVAAVALALALVMLIAASLGFGGPKNVIALLASLFTTSRERVFFIGPSHDATSGETLRLGWDQENIRGSGTFRLTYPCSANVEFAFADGTAIPCGSGAVIAQAAPLDVVPALDAADPVTIFVSIGFVPEGTAGASIIGSTAVAIRPRDTAPTAITPPMEAQTPAPTVRTGQPGLTPGERTVSVYEFPAGTTQTATTTTIMPPEPVPNGVPDLAVNVVSAGTADASGTAFAPATMIRKGERAAIVFDVTNRGKGTSAPWNFVVDLPTLEPYLFRSGTQAALLPGEKIRFTIGFSDIRAGTTTAVITIDPDNALTDADRGNDHASATFYRTPD